MSLDPETASMLRDSVEHYAADNYGFLQRHRILADPAGYSTSAWRTYAELGWLAMRLPEEDGGLNADPLAIGAIMEVVGSRLLMEPLLASAIVGTGLLLRQASKAQRQAMLPRLADGSLKLAFAQAEHGDAARACRLRGGHLFGSKVAVLHGDVADHWIVAAAAESADAAGSQRLFLVPSQDPAVQVARYRFVDGRGAANLDFSGANAQPLESGRESAEESIATVSAQATVAQCAEALGIVRMLVKATCDYLKVRKQFGRPIGSNQALQHRVVDMFLLQEEIAALTVAAQSSLDQPAAQRIRLVSGARAYICSAARHVANEAVQMHGGVGITEELEVSHYFRRLMVNAALFGGRDQHFARFLEATA